MTVRQDPGFVYSRCRASFRGGRFACACPAVWRAEAFAVVGGLGLAWAALSARCLWLMFQ